MDRRKHGGISEDDKQDIAREVARQVAELLERRGFAERIARIIEERLPPKLWAWLEQRFTLTVGGWTIRVFLLLAGAVCAAFYLFVQWLQTKGVM